ncbi:MFS transporter [Pseudodesulfovibrio sp. zrk46]|uniref:MFS transporter n=1 Tax=Pseudodesulfovibrio sp. zrk46 TaxID=2725288 RepID=UPI001449CE69|nr:MFS transporter [Pseudodesulfovibrio sp. zrk46]QJB57030.1 MFS transporter [Pseudodesulfovibrio sp. zrk46]
MARKDPTAAAMASSQLAAVCGLMLGMLVCGLDASIVNIILPTLQTVFKVNVSQSMMLATIYLTMLASLQMLFGRCADIFSASKVFLLGVIVFLIGSVGCALSFSFAHILTGRMVQGIGGAMLASSFGAVILKHVAREKTGSTIGIVLMIMSVGTIVGPPLGGYLAEHFSWHWAFLINVPLCLIGIGALLVHLRAVPARERKPFRSRLSLIDIKGGVLSILMFSSFPIALATVADSGWRSPQVWGLLLLFSISLVLFVMVEKRAEHPLVPLSLFGDQGVNILLAIKLFLLMVVNGVMIVFPFFLTRSVGMTASQAGVTMLANAIAMAIATPLGGKLTDLYGGKTIQAIASGCLALIAAGTLMLPASPGQMTLALVLALFGIAVAPLMVSSTTLLLERAPKGQEGVFSALNSLSVSVGGSLGLSLFASLYMFGSTGKSGVAAAQGGFSLALVGVVVCAVLLMAFAVFFMKREGRAPSSVTEHVRS